MSSKTSVPLVSVSIYMYHLILYIIYTRYVLYVYKKISYIITVLYKSDFKETVFFTKRIESFL